MRFFYFLIIVAIIYFLATQIKVSHIESLPDEQKKNLDNRTRLRTLLMNPHLNDNENKNKQKKTLEKFITDDNRLIGYSDEFSSEQKNSRNYKRDYYDFDDYVDSTNILPGGKDLFDLIKSEYVDNQYKFNIPNLPVTTRYPNRNTVDTDRKYLKYINQNINDWNKLFVKYYGTNKKLLTIRDIKPIFIMETTREFIIKLNVSLLYLERTIHFQLSYYGSIEKSDEFLNISQDMYNLPCPNEGRSNYLASQVTLQLVEIKPVAKKEFDLQISAINQNDDNGPMKLDARHLSFSEASAGPFMSMKEQLEYVDKINKMHKEEA